MISSSSISLAERLLEKFISFLKISFLVLSVLFFSSVSILSKFFLILILIFLFLIHLVLYSNHHQQTLTFQPLFFFLIIGVYLYLMCHSHFLSYIKFESKQEFLNYNLYLLVFFIFFILKKDKILIELNISFFVVQLFLFILFLFYKEQSIYFFNYNPNILSGYCLMVGLFTLYFILEQITATTQFEKNKIVFYIIGANFLFSLLFLILLKNFSSIIIIIAFILFKYSTKFFLNIIVLLSVLIFGIVYFFDSFLNRILWIIIGLKILFKNFFFGVGLGSFKFFYQEYANNLILPSIATTFIHNYFLHLSVEIGFCGIILIGGLFYSIIKIISENDKKFLYPLVGAILQNLVDYNLAIPQNSILFFVFLSCIIKEENCYQKEKIPKYLNITMYIFIIFLFLQGFILNSKFQQIDFLLNSFNKNDLKKVIEIDKTCWYVWKLLAITELKENNLNIAEEFFQKTTKFNPRDAESFLYLSLINFKSGRKKEGYKFFKEAIRLNPKASNRYRKLIEEMK